MANSMVHAFTTVKRMQIQRPHCRHTESDPRRWGSAYLCFNEPYNFLNKERNKRSCPCRDLELQETTRSHWGSSALAPWGPPSLFWAGAGVLTGRRGRLHHRQGSRQRESSARQEGTERGPSLPWSQQCPQTPARSLAHSRCSEQLCCVSE